MTTKREIADIDIKYWVAMHRVQGVGYKRFLKMDAFFGSIEEAWKASSEDLANAGLDKRTIQSICYAREKIDPDEEMECLKRFDITPIHCHSEKYPSLLRSIKDPPSLLYIRGNIETDETRLLAIVGTRRATHYGLKATQIISEGLAKAGVTIVSGLAVGIDEEAHRGALKEGGRTIAVLAGSLENIYPESNIDLATEISHNGALVTEHPLGTRLRPELFPRRNRIISGMCSGVLIAEAGMNSGALLTAWYAIEERGQAGDKVLMAVPGSIFSDYSTGCNLLIQQGAKLVTCVEEILEELNLLAIGRPEVNTEKVELMVQPKASRYTNPILAILASAKHPIHMDDLARNTNMTVMEISSALTLMEIQGEVRQIAPALFEIA